MSIDTAVKEYLDDNEVRYEVLEHATAYTTQEEAAATHVSGYEWAKTVIVLAGDEAVMAVLPGPYQVDLEALGELVGSDVRLAAEDEFAGLYPGCEPGAMPPLGPLYDQRVFVDRHLAESEDIVFDAGSHQAAVRMKYSDFEQLVEPTVGLFGDGPQPA